MRPSTALSADGPLNFYNAVAVAANKDAAGRGVLVVVNDWIHGASSLTKTSTTAVQTFLSPLSGLIGTVAYGEVEFYRGPVGRHTDRLRVLARRRDRAAARGHHHGLREHGRRAHRRRGRRRRQGHRHRRRRQRQHDRSRRSTTLAKHAKNGIVCVRASRVTTGRVGRNVEVDDDKLGLVASLDLNPQKARVLLRLALAQAADAGRPAAAVRRVLTTSGDSTAVSRVSPARRTSPVFGTTFGAAGSASVVRRHDLHAVLVEEILDVGVQRVRASNSRASWRSRPTSSVYCT